MLLLNLTIKTSVSAQNKNTSNTPLYCYVKHYTHLHFFAQLFEKVLPNLKPVYFTDNISLLLYIKFHKKATVKLTPIFFRHTKNAPSHLSRQTNKILQWEAAYMQKPKERVIGKYLYLTDWYASEMTKDGVSFCWSGNNTESHAFSQTAGQLNHVTYFGEVTNYPQTVYLDRHGTNYFSELVHKIRKSVMEQLSVNPEIIKKLKACKQGQKHIPQAFLKNKVLVFIVLYGVQQFILNSSKRFSVWRVIINKLKPLQTKQQELIKKGEFIDINKWTATSSKSEQKLKILVPLQVNHDTQLHVFSEFKSSFDYISYLLSIIDDRTEICIKLHPAEKKEINRLTTYLLDNISRKHPDIRLISSFDFSDYDAVATINSTFGIDGLLSSCKVITFGESLYSDFDFVLHYGRGRFSSFREAVTAYDELVNPDSFKYFAEAIQNAFYDFNYFGDTIGLGISEKNLKISIERLRSDISSSMSANHKK